MNRSLAATLSLVLLASSVAGGSALAAPHLPHFTGPGPYALSVVPAGNSLAHRRIRRGDTLPMRVEFKVPATSTAMTLTLRPFDAEISQTSGRFERNDSQTDRAVVIDVSGPSQNGRLIVPFGLRITGEQGAGVQATLQIRGSEEESDAETSFVVEFDADGVAKESNVLKINAKQSQKLSNSLETREKELTSVKTLPFDPSLLSGEDSLSVDVITGEPVESEEF